MQAACSERSASLRHCVFKIGVPFSRDCERVGRSDLEIRTEANRLRAIFWVRHLERDHVGEKRYTDVASDPANYCYAPLYLVDKVG